MGNIIDNITGKETCYLCKKEFPKTSQITLSNRTIGSGRNIGNIKNKHVVRVEVAQSYSCQQCEIRSGRSTNFISKEMYFDNGKACDQVIGMTVVNNNLTLMRVPLYCMCTIVRRIPIYKTIEVCPDCLNNTD